MSKHVQRTDGCKTPSCRCQHRHVCIENNGKANNRKAVLPSQDQAMPRSRFAAVNDRNRNRKPNKMNLVHASQKSARGATSAPGFETKPGKPRKPDLVCDSETQLIK